MPDCDYYDGFPQLENGVGMWTLFEDEFTEALRNCEVKEIHRKVTMVTGKAAFPLIDSLARAAMEQIKGLDAVVVPVINKLFGDTITVSGLITGHDIADTLEGADIGEELIIPPNCLRSEGDMFLDNMTVDELSNILGVKITRNGPGGADLLAAMIGGEQSGR